MTKWIHLKNTMLSEKYSCDILQKAKVSENRSVIAGKNEGIEMEEFGG